MPITLQCCLSIDRICDLTVHDSVYRKRGLRDVRAHDYFTSRQPSRSAGGGRFLKYLLLLTWWERGVERYHKDRADGVSDVLHFGSNSEVQQPAQAARDTVGIVVISELQYGYSLLFFKEGILIM